MNLSPETIEFLRILAWVWIGVAAVIGAGLIAVMFPWGGYTIMGFLTGVAAYILFAVKEKR